MNQGYVDTGRVGMEHRHQEGTGNDRGARKRLIAESASYQLEGG